MRCAFCKGFHNLESCVSYRKFYSLVNIKAKLKESFSGSSPSVFVGSFDYPNVNLGILAPPEIADDAEQLDDPVFWFNQDFGISQIVGFRSSLVNSKEKVNVKFNTRFLDDAQLIAMSSKAVDVDVDLKKVPSFNLSIDSFSAPSGPSAEVKNVDLVSSPKIHTKVDRVFSDADLKAVDAVNYLYENNFDENFLSKIFSVGVLGLKNNRRLVPTKWSITATDDIIAKNVISEIKDFGVVSDFSCFFDNYLGNYYLILLLPDSWCYELFEVHLPTKNVTTDYESFFGRKDYAENCVGGYYSVRLAVAEYLRRIKHQASVLVLRFISQEYSLPLGVWVTRQASRKSLSSKRLNFASKELLLSYAHSLIKNKFGYDMNVLINQSKLLQTFGKQSKLTNFF